jgi:hypothetical protein
MSQLGQKAKYSLRADVFRCSPDIGHSDEPVELASVRGDRVERETGSGNGCEAEFGSEPNHIARRLVRRADERVLNRFAVCRLDHQAACELIVGRFDRRCNATHLRRNCVAPTLTMQELLAAKSGRLVSA